MSTSKYRKRVDWTKPNFSMFVRSYIRSNQSMSLKQSDVIKAIMKKYDCSDTLAYYRLMGELASYPDVYTISRVRRSHYNLISVKLKFK